MSVSAPYEKPVRFPVRRISPVAISRFVKSHEWRIKGAESGLVLLVHGLELGRGVRVALEFSQEVQADDQQLDGGAG